MSVRALLVSPMYCVIQKKSRVLCRARKAKAESTRLIYVRARSVEWPWCRNRRMSSGLGAGIDSDKGTPDRKDTRHACKCNISHQLHSYTLNSKRSVTLRLVFTQANATYHINYAPTH
jgi:hypothetical protein